MTCRNCRESKVDSIWDLGNVPLSGVFLDLDQESAPFAKIELGLCSDCGLAQLLNNYNLDDLYGDGYGYQSNLNSSMRDHLISKINYVQEFVELTHGDWVCDIGSNDGTLINAFKNLTDNRIGMDPTVEKFRENYAPGTHVVGSFFSKDEYLKVTEKKAKIITSIAMFYDLEDPNKFIREIKEVLDENGIWHFEQSYAAWMVKVGAFDTICHEHLEYYTFNIIEKMLNQNGIKVIDVTLNQANGGSIAVTACHSHAHIGRDKYSILGEFLKISEKKMQIEKIDTWLDFKQKSLEKIKDIKDLFDLIEKRKETLAALGASTKGNILLHTLGDHANKIRVVGEVNVEKYGKHTSSGKIRIVPESQVISSKYNYLVLLPWHFRKTFDKLKAEVGRNTKFIVPLPEIEIF